MNKLPDVTFQLPLHVILHSMELLSFCNLVVDYSRLSYHGKLFGVTGTLLRVSKLWTLVYSAKIVDYKFSLV